MAGGPWSACKPALARFMCTDEEATWKQAHLPVAHLSSRSDVGRVTRNHFDCRWAAGIGITKSLQMPAAKRPTLNTLSQL